MMDKTYVGNNAEGIEYGDEQTITGVKLIGQEKTYSAGNETGFVLQIVTEWGSQTMANNILSQCSGFKFSPCSVENGVIDMAAEIGDGITVGGAYTILGYTDITFDNACLVNAKVGEAEETSEYPFIPSIQRKVVEASNKASSAMTAANTAQSTANTAQTTANNALSAAGSAQSSANTANDLITGFQYTGSSVKINGANLMANTVTASKLQGGTIELINSSQSVVAQMYLGASSSSTVSVNWAVVGGLKLATQNGDVFIGSHGDATALQITSSNLQSKGSFIPQSNNAYTLGNSSFKWSVVYSSTAEINTSDRKQKKDIEYDVSMYDGVYDDLKPVRYKLIDGTSDRYHTGFIAQDIEESLDKHGIPSKDFAAFVKDESGEEPIYGLRYEELIALNIRQIQSLKKRVSELENQIKELNNDGR